MALVIGLNTLVQWFNPLLYNRLVFGLISDLRQKVMLKLNQLPISYLDKKSIGDSVSRVTTDTERLSNGLLMVFNQFFVGLLTILFTVITMAEIDWFMLILVLVLTPLSLLVARFIANKSYHLYQNQTRSVKQQTQYIEEMIRQESLLQNFNAQSQTIKQFETINNTYAKLLTRGDFLLLNGQPINTLHQQSDLCTLAGLELCALCQVLSQLVNSQPSSTMLTNIPNLLMTFPQYCRKCRAPLLIAERLYMILDEEVVVLQP